MPGSSLEDCLSANSLMPVKRARASSRRRCERIEYRDHSALACPRAAIATEALGVGYPRVWVNARSSILSDPTRSISGSIRRDHPLWVHEE